MFLFFVRMNFEKKIKNTFYFNQNLYHVDLHCKPMTGFNVSPRHLNSAYMRQVEYYREDNSNGLRCKNYLIVYHFLGFSMWLLEQ